MQTQGGRVSNHSEKCKFGVNAVNRDSKLTNGHKNIAEYVARTSKQGKIIEQCI